MEKENVSALSDDVKAIYLELKAREKEVSKEWFKKRRSFYIAPLISMISIFISYLAFPKPLILGLWILCIVLVVGLFFYDRKCYIEANMFPETEE